VTPAAGSTDDDEPAAAAGFPTAAGATQRVAAVVAPADTAESAGSGSLRRALVCAAGSRLVLFVVAFASAAIIGVPSPSWTRRFPAGAEVFHGAFGWLFNPWAHWDGSWYVKIAQYGYSSADGTAAFFPLYPLLLRGVGYVFGGNLVIAGIVISLACYAGVIVVLYRLVALDFGQRTAFRATLYLSIFPTAFFFQAVYGESLLLLTALLCIYWCRTAHWRLAGLAALLAALTRSIGVLLIVPMAVMYLQSIDWRWRRLDARGASLLLAPEGLLLWMAYLALAFGNPLLFLTSQGQWHRGLATPNYALWHGLESVAQGLRQLFSGQSAHLFWPVEGNGSPFALANVNITAFLITAAACVLLLYGARRLPLSYTVWSLLAIGFPLLFPNTFQPLYSMPRFVLAAFPIFIALALFTERRPRAHIAVVIVSSVVLLALTVQFAIFAWVA
jgi:hypothetical protein